MPDEALDANSSLLVAKHILGEALQNNLRQKVMIPTLILKTTPDKLIFALNELISKPAKLECTIALNVVKIFCLKEILGENFNAFANQFYQMVNAEESWSADEFFNELCGQFLTQLPEKAVPGSITYITNVGEYIGFKPSGNAQGSNLIALADQKFLGFSAIYRQGPQLLEAIEKQDLKLFCQTEDVEYDSDKHLILSDYFKKDSEFFYRLRRELQKEIDFHIIFDLEKILEFHTLGNVYI